MVCDLFLLASFLFGLVSGHLPDDSKIRYFGRFDQSVDRQTEWPGSKLIMTVQAMESTVSLTLSPLVSSTTHYFVGIELNCLYSNRYEISNTTSKFQVTLDNLNPGTVYEIGVVKISEAHNGDSIGTMAFNGLDIVGGNLLPSTPSTCYKEMFKLLVVGDSITAAYGVDGTDEYCHYTASTQNILESYATLVAQSIDASVHTIAWSGKGVVRNYGDSNPTSTEPMPIYYNRTLATDSTLYWNPSNYIPDIAIIALGANDYSTQPNPSDSDFQTGLTNLVNQIKSDYPSAKIVLMCEPGPSGNQCANIEAVSMKTASTYVRIPNDAIVSYGCDYHPSVESQVNIANIVIPVVKSLL
jgi:lysophospholipase L1-like esterase